MINLKGKDIRQLDTGKHKQSKEIIEQIDFLYEKFTMILNNDDRISEVGYDNIHKKICFVVREKHGEKLQSKLDNCISTYLKSKLIDINQGLTEFKEISSIYKIFLDKVKLIKKLLFYYESNYIQKNSLSEFISFSKKCFEREILNNDILIKFNVFLKEQITNDLDDLQNHIFKIEADSNIDRFTLSLTIKIILDINKKMYIDTIEPEILNILMNKFANLMIKLLVVNDSTSDIHKVKTFFINFELFSRLISNLIDDYCIDVSRQKINKILYTCFIKKIFEEEVFLISNYLNYQFSELSANLDISQALRELVFINNICVSCLVKEDKDFYITSYLKLLGKSCINVIKNITSNKSSNSSNDPTIINLLSFLFNVEILKKSLSVSFETDYMLCFNIIVKQYFSEVNNKQNQVITKQLINTIDYYFKATSRISEDELIEVISKVCEMLKYIEDKDVFEHYYRKSLSGRILTPRQFNETVEIKFLSN